MRNQRFTSPIGPLTAAFAALGAGLLLAGCAGAAAPGATDPVTSGASVTTVASASPTVAAPEPATTTVTAEVTVTDESDTDRPAPAQPGTGDQPATDPVDPVAPVAVTGSPHWESVAVDGHTLVGGTVVALDTTDGRLTAAAGCNTLSGALTENEDGTWTVTELSRTEIGCSAELQAQDDWLASFLTSGPSAQYDHSSVSLVAGDVAIHFEQVSPGPDDALWLLHNSPEGHPVVLSLSDGRLEVTGLCNPVTGTATIDGSRLSVRLDPSTQVSCELDATESLVRQVLEGESSWNTVDRTMHILKPDRLGLAFNATGPGWD